MTKFVIDKNIIYNLMTKEDTKPIKVTGLLTSIIEECHNIVCTEEMKNSYYTIIERFENVQDKHFASRILGWLSNKFRIDKIEFDNPRLIELGVKDEDIPFASLAIKDDAILITEDAPLRDAIKDYCQCLTIEEALEYVRKHD